MKATAVLYSNTPHFHPRQLWLDEWDWSVFIHINIHDLHVQCVQNTVQFAGPVFTNVTTKLVKRVNFLIYTSSQIWINKLYIEVWYLAEIKRFKYLESEGARNQTIEKIALKVVQMKFLAMHITNQKLYFNMITVGNVPNIFMEHDLSLIS